ncbi:MAG: ribonuclease Z [Bacteroidales bacterium]|nr:ribonuclease Z [Bacteroidales bacterium]
MMTFSVTILGSNSAVPTIARNPSSQLLNINEQLFLIDCAEGTQIQLKKSRIKSQRINNIFISHLHGDHYYGLIGLMTSLHLFGRTKELIIFANSELENIINIQLEASKTKLCYPVVFHSLSYKEPKIIYEDRKIIIKSFALNHSVPTCGFLFTIKNRERGIKKEIITELNIPVSEIINIKNGKDYVDENGKRYKNSYLTKEPIPPCSYAYCSDTGYFEDIIPVIKNVDTLYHEATFMEDRIQNANEKLHSTAIQAANIAKKANAGKLIIGHYSARYKDLQPILSEAKSVFENSFAAEDGKVFDIENY